MCGFCAMFSNGPHWTEAGTDSGRAGADASPRERHLDRAYRMKLINRILGFYGCTAEDWAGSQYIVRNKSGGAGEVVANLPQVWQAVENMLHRPADPLDAALVAALEGSP